MRPVTEGYQSVERVRMPFDKCILNAVEGLRANGPFGGLRVSGFDLYEINHLPLMLSVSKHWVGLFNGLL